MYIDVIIIIRNILQDSNIKFSLGVLLRRELLVHGAPLSDLQAARAFLPL